MHIMFFAKKSSNMCVNDAFINALLCMLSINTEESVDKTINLKMQTCQLRLVVTQSMQIFHALY